MSIPIIIAIPIAIVYFILWVLFNIIREWWKFRQQDKQVYKQVTESERPALIKPKRFYRGKVEF